MSSDEELRAFFRAQQLHAVADVVLRRRATELETELEALRAYLQAHAPLTLAAFNLTREQHGHL